MFFLIMCNNVKFIFRYNIYMHIHCFLFENPVINQLI